MSPFTEGSLVGGSHRVSCGDFLLKITLLMLVLPALGAQGSVRVTALQRLKVSSGIHLVGPIRSTRGRTEGSMT